MLAGLLEQTMTRPALRMPAEARQAGESATMGLVEQAMQRAKNPPLHRSQSEKARRRWGGSWVSHGHGMGHRAPTLASAPRLKPLGPDGSELAEALSARFNQRAQATDHPSAFAGGGFFAGDSAGVSQGLASLDSAQSIASLRSALGLGSSWEGFRRAR